jgi:hypothetical protein|tara:strand:- start:971 stop:1360 length:390 start_codon:yes stop_codon:yes gene_type:complete
MPFYDFYCKECKILIEDEFFKLADEKIVECAECRNRMEQAFLKAPGLRDPGGIGQKWTNDGYQMRSKDAGLRIVTEKWEKGKNVIRDDVHKSDPIPNHVHDSIFKTSNGDSMALISKTPISIPMKKKIK